MDVACGFDSSVRNRCSDLILRVDESCPLWQLAGAQSGRTAADRLELAIAVGSGTARQLEFLSSCLSLRAIAFDEFFGRCLLVYWRTLESADARESDSGVDSIRVGQFL